MVAAKALEGIKIDIQPIGGKGGAEAHHALVLENLIKMLGLLGLAFMRASSFERLHLIEFDRVSDQESSERNPYPGLNLEMDLQRSQYRVHNNES